MSQLPQVLPYLRGLETSMGKLSLEVPRTRYFNFRPFIIPSPYKRAEESYNRLLLSGPLFPLLA